MGWGNKAIEIRAAETGHLDGVFMHKKAQKLKFLCERNDKVSIFSWFVDWLYLKVRFMVFNTTFNNISVISWRSVLLLEKTTNLPHVTDKLYHIMLYRVHLTWAGFELVMLVVIGTDFIGGYQSNYHTITISEQYFSYMHDNMAFITSCTSYGTSYVFDSCHTNEGLLGRVLPYTTRRLLFRGCCSLQWETRSYIYTLGFCWWVKLV